jgi:hypothetical protein
MQAAEHPWVQGQAPLHVAPTRHVVGHMRIYRPSAASSTLGWPTALDIRQPLSAIGRLPS